MVANRIRGTPPGKGNAAMRKDTEPEADASTVCYEGLEAFARESVQELLQRTLEAEVTELLGRVRHERRGLDATVGYRNGHGKLRKFSMVLGTVQVRRPRVRGLDERFESRVLPLFRRRTEEIGRMLPDLYLHGLSQGDFDLALRGLLGEGAPLSSSSIARLKAGWHAEYESWKQRSLKDAEVIYLWVDGVYVKAGLEKEKAAALVAVAGLRDGRKVVIALQSGQRESTESWAAILRDMKARGMGCPKLVIGDGHLGIWGALAEVFPGAAEQRCWNHRLVNILDRVPEKAQAEAKALLTKIVYAETKQEAERRKVVFQAWGRRKGFLDAAALIDKDWDRMMAFYAFPKEHWRHLRTTNVIESPFAVVRLRTGPAKRFKKVENATAVIWKTLLLAERSFRRLNAPELLAEVAEGARYVDGIRVKGKTPQKEAA